MARALSGLDLFSSNSDATPVIPGAEGLMSPPSSSTARHSLGTAEPNADAAPYGGASSTAAAEEGFAAVRRAAVAAALGRTSFEAAAASSSSSSSPLAARGGADGAGDGTSAARRPTVAEGLFKGLGQHGPGRSTAGQRCGQKAIRLNLCCAAQWSMPCDHACPL